MAGADRRRFKRVQAKQASAAVRADQRQLGPRLEIENISLGGVFVRTEDPLPVGTPLVLELAHPSLPQPLRLVGTAVSSKDPVHALTAGGFPGMGIRFEALAPETTRRLSAFLVELTARKDAIVLGAYNPALIDEATAISRNAFDFGFVSLEQGAEEPAPPSQRPSTRSEGPRPGTLQKLVKRAAPSPGTSSAASGRLVETPAPPLTAAPPPVPVRPEESARLMIQVRGLLSDLDETKSELARRSQEIETLRAELQRTREALEAKNLRMAELERWLARRGS